MTCYKFEVGDKVKVTPKNRQQLDQMKRLNNAHIFLNEVVTIEKELDDGYYALSFLDHGIKWRLNEYIHESCLELVERESAIQDDIFLSLLMM